MIVYLKFYDMTSYCDAWVDQDDFKQMSLAHNEACGLLVEEDNNRVVLCASKNTNTGEMFNIIMIPKGAIFYRKEYIIQ